MLKRIKIEDSVTGGRGEVFTNVDCIDELRDFLKAYASARDVNNDTGKWSKDTEYMSDEFCQAVLAKWLSDMERS